MGREEKSLPQVGKAAPDFQLTDLSGKQVELKQVYPQNRITLVNFWGSWCPPCKMEIPEFIQFYSEYRKKGLEILAVNTWDNNSLETIKEFAETVGMNFPVLLDTKNEVVKLYGVRAVPTTFFLDHTGRIKEIFTGMINYNQLKARMEKYLP
jgi:peroxiredoxin